MVETIATQRQLRCAFAPTLLSMSVAIKLIISHFARFCNRIVSFRQRVAARQLFSRERSAEKNGGGAPLRRPD
jgi:hypothetical protein